MKGWFWIIALCLSTSALAQVTSPTHVAQTFIVDNPGDAPADSVPVFFPRTLRAAIQCANFTPALDEIRFVAVGLIRPASALPNISQPILLDGRLGTAKIILDGSLIPPPPPGSAYLGLAVVGGASTVTDIEIKNFPSGGILLRGNNNVIRRCDIHNNGRLGLNLNAASSNRIVQNTIYGNAGQGMSLLVGSNGNRIDSNLIGTPDGFTRSPNNGTGVLIETRNNILLDNVISGNDGDGIELFASGSDTSKFNVIAYNYIGTERGGNAPLANNGTGIRALVSVADTICANQISGNTEDGIALSRPVRDMYIFDNLIGTHRRGDVAIPNSSGINSSGLNIVITNNTISGNLFEGIALQNYGRAFIKGNKIGTDSSGTDGLPNGTVGIAIRSSTNHVIGGLLPGERNIISGNGTSGIEINGLAASGNIVEGNYIGTDRTGMVAVSNGANGVIITQGSFNDTIRSNLISGNVGHGILVTPRFRQVPHDNLIVKNDIGTRVGGLTGLGNVGCGIAIINARNTMVGNGAVGDGNVISGNFLDGVLITGDTATANIVSGNLIGLAADGQGTIPNRGAGVTILNAANNEIGDNLAQAANYIAGNIGPGVWLFGEGTTSNIITNNLIGIGVGGFVRPNSSGIVIDGAQGNFIGSGPIGAPQNTIAHNAGDGVQVLTTARRNFIRFNSIFSNNELGIDLGNDGVSANDPLDADTGPNELQNYPRLLFAALGTNPRVYGSLQSTPLAEFEIDLYSNAICDPTNHGEGQTYLASVTVTTDAFGNARFLSPIPPIPMTHMITATATDSNDNTSEFARCIPITVPGPYADLAVTVTDSADTVDRADTLLYRLRVFNDGPEAATGIIVSDTLSPRVTYLADSTTHGTCTYSNGILTCTIPRLEPFEEARIRVIARADSIGIAINKARITSSTLDFNPLNNTDFDTTYVRLLTAIGSHFDIPTEFQLYQNYPNPFNPSTTITYKIPNANHITLMVYDVLGREVATLVNELKQPGKYEVQWDAKNFSSGLYFYRMAAGTFVETKKLLLLR